MRKLSVLTIFIFLGHNLAWASDALDDLLQKYKAPAAGPQPTADSRGASAGIEHQGQAG